MPDNASTGSPLRPLEGIRVLDFSHGVAGPFCTMLLGDLGADVIKIEHPRRGDNTRYMNVSRKFRSDIPRAGGDYFMAINRNKRSLTLDLKKEEGRKIALDMAEWADVAVSNFRPGVMEKLGVGYADLSAKNPKLIYASVSAYGEKGPLAHQPGMDIAVQARSGVMSITGYPEFGRPVKPGVSLADLSGGTHLVIAIQGALIHRERTGKGQEVSVSLLDATMNMLINYSVAVIDGEADIKPMGSGHPQLVPFQAFTTKDGYIVISPGTNKLFRELCRLLEVEHLVEDPRFATNPDRVEHREELIPLLEEVLRRRTTKDWTEFFESVQMPCAPVNSMKAAFAQEQLVANKTIVEIPHPIEGKIHVVGNPYKFHGSPCEIYKSPPLLGADTSNILKDILGRSKEEVEQLVSSGVVSLDKP
jgi:crotonobetainyl-CoA:carnitine CoA-transferase CaiB-like acyl-CoA transferase